MAGSPLAQGTLPGSGRVSRLLNGTEGSAAASGEEVNPSHEDPRLASQLGADTMPGPVFLLKRRRLEDALTRIKTSSDDLAEKRRAAAEPVLKIMENMAALPVFVFICNI